MTDFTRTKGQLYMGPKSLVSLAEDFSTPLYAYSEQTLRSRCQQLKQSFEGLTLCYSAKANSNVALLQIIKDEGIGVDAMSEGEIIQEMAAGYHPEDILFVSNNVTTAHFGRVAAMGINRVVVDSMDQMRRWLAVKPGAHVVLRLNPTQGAGHHQKVITAGKVKFGFDPNLLDQAILEAKELGGKVAGLMIHIGSLFMDPEPWLKAIDWLLDIAKAHPELEYLDFGGGMGVPYNRTTDQPFPMESFAKSLNQRLQGYCEETGTNPEFAIEPGRFLVAECGFCLAEVQSVKVNQGIKFIGTNLGFNFLIRPEMYGAYHEICHVTKEENSQTPVQVVGNVCESGDYLGQDRLLPETEVGDLLLIRDTGAYGFSMSSNYNSMAKPAEVLVDLKGHTKVIRAAEEPSGILKGQIYQT